MIKKLLLGIVVLYLLGVFGASAGYLSLNWSDEWTLSELLGEAGQVGVAWPISVVEKMAGP
jgi:hypothetical protein